MQVYAVFKHAPGQEAVPCDEHGIFDSASTGETLKAAYAAVKPPQGPAAAASPHVADEDEEQAAAEADAAAAAADDDEGCSGTTLPLSPRDMSGVEDPYEESQAE